MRGRPGEREGKRRDERKIQKRRDEMSGTKMKAK